MAAENKTGTKAAPDPALRRLGKYEIEKKLGQGGMGTVFLARDVNLKRVVALKVLSKEKAQNPTLVKRFQAEAQAAAQLRHDNIVAVYDSGEDQGYLYIAMEYIEGQDLFDVLQKRGIMPVKRSIDIMKQAAAALQHAYEQNIVHRDIKPSNLLITRTGRVKLTDLGLARSVDDTLETNITRAGTTVGTVDYMSPEQGRNSKAADIRSDLYSLGCTWYQMLTGEPPFPEGSLTNKLQAHAIKPPPDPRDKNPNVPEGVTAVIHRLMAKKPDDRYQTPAELIEDLARSTLTNANVSREIFDDLSGDEHSTYSSGGEDEPEEDDGYFDSEDDSSANSEGTKGPSLDAKRQKYAKSVERSRAARADDDGEVDDSDEESPDDLPPAPGAPAKRKKKRAAASDTDNDNATDTKPSSKKSTGGKSADAGEAKPSKPKGPKALPPKQKPTLQPVQVKASFLNPEILKYGGILLGLIVVVAGLGYIFSSLGGKSTQEANPFAAQDEKNAALNAAVGTPVKDTTNKEPDNPTVDQSTQKPPAPVDGPAFDAEKMPEWVAKAVDTKGATEFTVGPGTPSATHFGTLADALNATAIDVHTVIKLIGNGPFPLPWSELTRSKRLMLTAAEPKDTPIILLKPVEGQSKAGLTIKGGTLEVRGLHFVVDRTLATDSIHMLENIDGQLIVRQCSFTSTGKAETPATAMVFTSGTDSSLEPALEPTLLVDRVVVRGEGLGAVSIDRAMTDAVVQDSLLATGSAPVIRLAGRIAPARADVRSNRPTRVVRILRSTLSARDKTFDLAAEDSNGKPPRTTLVLIDTLCGAQGVASDATLIAASRWPQTKSTSESWLTRLTWLSKSSIYSGYEQLIDLGADSSFKVVDASNWQRVWNATSDARQFLKITFPEESIDDLGAVTPQLFDTARLAVREIKATDGGQPGCLISKVAVPDIGSQSRVAALSRRPLIPANVLNSANLKPTFVRPVDLNKEDLGEAINRNEWPTGTLIEATGSGVKLMSLAKIQGKSVRILFRQGDGPALKLQPRGGDSRGGNLASLFSVTNGSLELVNAALEGTTNPKANVGPWLIQSNDSTLILTGCRLNGSEVDGPHQAGLVRWITSAPAAGGTTSPLFFCRDSLLATQGNAVQLECGQGGAIVRNSILSARGTALNVLPVRVGDALLTAVELEQVTISATVAGIHLQAAPGDAEISKPLRMIIDRCAFVAPLAFRADEGGGATMLNLAGPVLEQKQLDWWGSSNGAASALKHLIHRDGDPAEASDKTGLPSWKETFVAGQDSRLLTGDKGVFLTGELPNKWKDLKPSSFELHKSSQAASWAEGSRPIGADIRKVEELSLVKKGGPPAPTTAGTTNPGTGKTKPGTTPPVTKKNVGF